VLHVCFHLDALNVPFQLLTLECHLNYLVQLFYFHPQLKVDRVQLFYLLVPLGVDFRLFEHLLILGLLIGLTLSSLILGRITSHLILARISHV
jgi:hypothetical protein